MYQEEIFLLLITAFQTFIKCINSNSNNDPISSFFTFINSLIFSFLLLLILFAYIGFAGVTGDNGNNNNNNDSDGDNNSNDDSDGNGDGTGIVFCLFFATFVFFFAFFIGGYKITKVGIN